MNRRRPWLRTGLMSAGLLGIVLPLAGCELGKRALRRGSDPLAAVSTPAGVDDVGRTGDDIELPADDTRGFFKPNRLSGAWSSEAAEIEQSLGVPR